MNASIIYQLGILEIPLLLCSIVASTIILERIIILLRYDLKKWLIVQGLMLVDNYRQHSREIRSEIASAWLQQQKQKLSSGLRLLNLVILISPLLGLLGTVLGLINSFDTIGKQSGPVEVSMLADGLGVAMSTTAVGLMIALPSLVVLHLYYLWIDVLLSRAEASMNALNLSLDNIKIRTQ